MFENNGYNCISVYLEDGTEYKLPEHRVNALLEHSLKEVVNNVVHHKNGVRFDNRVENLELLSKSEHTIHHIKGKKYRFNPRLKIKKRKK